ncbi:MAG: hypothetical protein J5I93_23550 [Pirellulaceae bacterium]|nr:hypothetical protein [Pirellulaceae bacterium]
MTRGVTFWNDETIELINTRFIAAAVPTWTCRVPGPEGEFLRGAGIDKHWVTSSGYMSCVSASGRLLGRQPCAEVLEAFAELPESERAPGAIQVPELKPEEAVIPRPPAGGLVLRVHARFLHREPGGELRRATTADFPLMRDEPRIQESWQLFLQPNTEFMWLTREEWQSLVPSQPVKGNQLNVDARIVERMARFHLTPQRATTSEGGIVDRRSVKTARAVLIVDDVSPSRIRLELAGHVHWGSEFDESQATSPNGPLAQGFETPLFGRLEYDRTKKMLTRFDIVAPGDVWGRWGDANGKSMYVERPGRAPFGFALELAWGDSPTDRIPPGGNGRYVENTGYFAAQEGPGPRKP